MAQVGKTRQVIHSCSQSVVLNVGQPLIFGKARLPKPEANVKRVSVDILRKDPAPQEQCPVTSVCEQSSSDRDIASLFDFVVPDEEIVKDGGIDSVILQNNTVFINVEAPVSFITAELSSL